MKLAIKKITMKDLEYINTLSFSMAFYGAMNIAFLFGEFELPTMYESVALIIIGSLIGALSINKMKKLRT